MLSRDTLTIAVRIASATVVLLIVWQALVQMTKVPSYILPAPDAIAQQIWVKAPLIADNLMVTLVEALGGLAIAIVMALTIAVLVVHSSLVRDTVYPMMVALQAVPKVAIAPLCVAWFGLGVEPKLVLAALLCFFPLLIASITGLSSVDQDMLDLARSHGASRLKILLLMRVPRCLPYFMDGMKISLPGAVIGAIVGEFVAGQKGIGVLIVQSSAALEVPLTFAAVFVLAVTTTGLFGLLLICEYTFLRWHRLELGHAEA
jgi:NitT/TauT family transport system permease protein